MLDTRYNRLIHVLHGGLHRPWHVDSRTGRVAHTADQVAEAAANHGNAGADGSAVPPSFGPRRNPQRCYSPYGSCCLPQQKALSARVKIGSLKDLSIL